MDTIQYKDPVTGEVYEDHLFEYQHGGSRWDITICATSREDAEERISKMQFATYLGRSCGTIPAFPGAGLWLRVWCWWKNLTSRPA
jgi:hypothetical protein